MKPETRAEYRLRLLLRVERAGYRGDKNDLTHVLLETFYVVSDKDLKQAWKDGAAHKKQGYPYPENVSKR